MTPDTTAVAVADTAGLGGLPPPHVPFMAIIGWPLIIAVVWMAGSLYLTRRKG